MSLDYNLRKVPVKHKRLAVTDEMKVPGYLCYEKNGKRYMLNPVTYALIWATISVGLGEITTETAPEFWSRLQVLSGVDKPFTRVSFWNRDVKDWWRRELQPEDIVHHIGLSTNVSFETRQAWLERVISYEMDKLVRAFCEETKLKAPPAEEEEEDA